MLSASAALVCTVLTTDPEKDCLLREEFEGSLHLHRKVFLALSADMSSLLCEGPEMIAVEGSSLTRAGVPPDLLEVEFKTHVAEVIFASVLLHSYKDGE